MALASKPALRLPMRVWDLPIRLFHWLVVLLVAVSYVSISLSDQGSIWISIHLISGYAMLVLLLFRLVWGMIGSETARFAKFLRDPITGLRHLAQFGRNGPDDQVGHNEAGGWMVLIMLALLAAQVATGLFANDDVAIEGPLAKYVGKSTSDWLSSLHGVVFNVLMGSIVLHVVAIIAYAVYKRHDLVRPMITGKKRLPATTRAPRMASVVLAGMVLAACAGGVVILLAFA